MAHVLFLDCSYSWHEKKEECLAGKFRLSIFLIAAECGGLPALVWALRVLYRRYKSGGQISVLVIVLLLSDLLELLLNPYIMIKLLQNKICWKTSTTCWTLISLWSASLIYGLHFQQIVVLEGALAFRHPHCSSHAFFPSCSIITSIIAFFCIFLCEFFRVLHFLIFTLPVLLIVAVTSCIITCRAPPQIIHIPYRTRKPSSTVLAFVSITIILYITLIIVCIIGWMSQNLWVMYFSLMSLRVFFDPLLCVLVYRKDLKIQTPETQAEHNANLELPQI